MHRLTSAAWKRLVLGCMVLGLAASTLQAAPPPQQLIPDNTEILIHFNIKSFMESPLAKKGLNDLFKKMIDENQQFKDVIKSMGFDPLKDLTSVTVAMGNFKIDMAGGPPQPDVEALILLKGKFDVAKLDTGLKTLISAGGQDKVSISEWAGKTVYELKEGNKPMFACFLDNETMAASDRKEELQHVLDRMGGKKTTKLSKEFTTMLEKADQKRTGYMAMLMPGSVKDLSTAMPNGEIVEKIEGINIILDVKENIIIDINAFTTDDAAAKQFETMLNQAKDFLGIMALNAPDAEDSKDIGDMISGMRISANNKLVSVKLEIKGTLIERAIKKAQER